MLILSTLQTFVLKSVQTSFPVFILNFFIVKSISIFLWTVPLTTISLLNFTGQSPRLQRNKTPSGKKSNFFDCNRDARLFVLCANWYAVFIHYTIARNSSRPLPQLPPLQTHTDIFSISCCFVKPAAVMMHNVHYVFNISWTYWTRVPCKIFVKSIKVDMVNLIFP